MKLILLNGPSCSGKSTVVKSILRQRKHLFHLSYDSLKWSFSQYSPNEQADDVRTALLSLAGSVFKMKYDVICDSVLFREWRVRLLDLALKYSYGVEEINFEASQETLLNRFDQRVADAFTNPERKISNLSKERFRELCDTYAKEKSVSATTFRTDQLSIDELTEAFMKLFQSQPTK